MHSIKEIPAWDRLLKRIVWEQIGQIEGKKILDFGSGQGITANYFAQSNEVIAIEPSNDGNMSLVKHNRPGRIMQMAVLLNDFEKANDLLDGKNSTASKFGEIKYYNDEDILKWCPELNIKEDLGIRTFWDLQQNQEMHDDENWQINMMKLEMRCSNIEEFQKIAFFHHLLINKK